MPITITTTTVVETLDDLTDALEALREVSVDTLEVSGLIDFLALAQLRHERTLAAAEAALMATATAEAADIISRVPTDDLSRRTLAELTGSERVGILSDFYPMLMRRTLSELRAEHTELDEVFLSTRRERIIEIAAEHEQRFTAERCAGLAQGYFARFNRAQAADQLFAFVNQLRVLAESDLAATADRAAS